MTEFCKACQTTDASIDRDKVHHLADYPFDQHISAANGRKKFSLENHLIRPKICKPFHLADLSFDRNYNLHHLTEKPANHFIWPKKWWIKAELIEIYPGAQWRNGKLSSSDLTATTATHRQAPMDFTGWDRSLDGGGGGGGGFYSFFYNFFSLFLVCSWPSEKCIVRWG